MNLNPFSKPLFFVFVIALLAGVLALTAGVNAQTPEPETPVETTAPESPAAPSSLLFSYQGYLEDSNGNPVTGSVPMTFKFYDVPTGGTACWMETHPAVDVREGIFNVLLGQITAMDTNCLSGDVYLELVVDGETFAPREAMASTFHSNESDILSPNAEALGDMRVNGVLNIRGESTGVIVDARDDGRIGFLKYSGREGGIWRLSNQDFEIGRVDANVTALPGSPESFITDIYVAGNGYVGIGTTNPEVDLQVTDWRSRVRVQSTGENNRAAVNFQTANGTIWEVGKRDTDDQLYFSYFDGSSWHERVHVDTNGNMTCGGLVENNLQTPEEQQAESIERFNEGDVLCWSPENDRLEKCVAANDRLVMAVASPDGKPIVIGAEVIKVIGPVQAGDILVSSDMPGYAMVNNNPAPGTVIAQALEDFEGEQGVIKAMIRKW